MPYHMIYSTVCVVICMFRTVILHPVLVHVKMCSSLQIHFKLSTYIKLHRNCIFL